jgi:hypothetical protein
MSGGSPPFQMVQKSMAVVLHPCACLSDHELPTCMGAMPACGPWPVNICQAMTPKLNTCTSSRGEVCAVQLMVIYIIGSNMLLTMGLINPASDTHIGFAGHLAS